MALLRQFFEVPWPRRALVCLALGYGIVGGLMSYAGFVPDERAWDYTDLDSQATFRYGLTAARHPRYFNTVIVYAIGERATLAVHVPEQEFLSMKLKVAFKQAGQTLTIQANDTTIGTVTGREAFAAQKFFLKIPAQHVRAGLNNLTLINHAPNHSYIVEEIIIRNFRSIGKLKLGAILYKESTFLSRRRPQMGLGWILLRTILAGGLLIGAWRAGMAMSQAVLAVTPRQAAQWNLIGLWIPFITMAMTHFASWTSDYVILLADKTMVAAGLAGLVSLNGFLIIIWLLSRSSTWLLTTYMSYIELLSYHLGITIDQRTPWRVALTVSGELLWRSLRMVLPPRLLKPIWVTLKTTVLLAGFLLYLLGLVLQWWLQRSPIEHSIRFFIVLMGMSVIPLLVTWRGGAEQLANWAFGFLAVGIVAAIVEMARQGVETTTVTRKNETLAPSLITDGATNRPLRYLEAFDDGMPNAFHEIVHSYAAPYLAHGRSLNVGCWTGGFEALVQPSQRVISVDLEPKALSVVRRVAPTIPVVCAQAQRLPFRDGTFDTVTLFTVLEHLPAGREGEVLAELYRVLEPGGALILTTPRQHWLGNLADVAWWLAGHRHYHSKQVRALLGDQGFEIERLDFRGRWFSTVTIPVFYLWKYLFRRNLYRTPWVSRRLNAEYATDGFRDLFVVARKPSMAEPREPLTGQGIPSMIALKS